MGLGRSRHADYRPTKKPLPEEEAMSQFSTPAFLLSLGLPRRSWHLLAAPFAQRQGLPGFIGPVPPPLWISGKRCGPYPRYAIVEYYDRHSSNWCQDMEWGFFHPSLISPGLNSRARRPSLLRP